MTTRWATARLDQVLTQDTEYITTPEARQYPKLSVKLYGRGVVLDAPTNGASLKMSRHQLAKPGQVILSEIWGKKGAIGIVPPEGDGALCTSHFFLFDVVSERADILLLDWIFRANFLEDQLNVEARGTTGYAAVRPKHLLNCQIPLPSLVEQRRIVVRIEELFSHLKRARELRREATAETEQLLAAKEMELWPAESLEGARTLADVSTFLARGRQSEQGESDHFLIKTQHVQQGFLAQTTLRLAPHVAVKVASEAIVVDGDILIACSAAGCLGRVARYRDDARIASTDTHVAIVRPDSNVVDPDYLYAYLRGAQGQHQIRSRERGDWQREKVSFRLTELNLSDLKKVPVPVPSKMEQRELLLRLTSVRAEVERLAKVQAETAAALDAMMPAILDRAFRGEL